MQALVGAVLAVFVLVVGFCVFRSWRRKRTRAHSYAKPADADADASDGSSMRHRTALAQTVSHASASASASAAAQSGIDRNTSVRSVMTLPAYRVRAADTEQVLGREGERDGIDVVVEMPTAEEEEALRDDEMEALYQMRLARRQQVAAHDARREQRRAARERNDAIALEDVRRRARDAAAQLDALRRGHERAKQTRRRAVSSVSYADLGVARADGTRLRANSNESECAGLLSDAASIAASQHSAGLCHSRNGSASSAAPSTATATTAPAPAPAPTDGPFGSVAGGDEEGPPPDYSPGPGAAPRHRLSTSMGDLTDSGGGGGGRPNVPQLPALNLESLPQIVIEPSSARPGEEEEEEEDHPLESGPSRQG